MAEWVYCGSTPGYLSGWSADMGEYHGPWPFLWPPSLNPDGFSGFIEFLVMLPNPLDSGDPGLAGDGSYDTYIYGTYLGYPGGWGDGGWFNTERGPTSPNSPIPPVQQSGAHLYVSVFNGSGSPPTFTPGSVVPGRYGGTNPQEWTAGDWSAEQPPSTSPGTGGSNGFAGPAMDFLERDTGYTNNVAWAGITGLTFATEPFPTMDFGGVVARLDSDIAAAYPGPGAFAGGMLQLLTEKHAYDPGDGTGIHALGGFVAASGPNVTAQLGQFHSTTVVSLNPNERPPFFNGTYGSVWGYQPWDDNFTSWDPAGPDTMAFVDYPAAPLFTAGFAVYQGPQPANPGPLTINVYGRQTTWPANLDPGAGPVGNFQDTSGMTFLASFTATVDFASGGYSSPSTLDLALSTVPMTSDGSDHWGLELVFEPQAWHTGVDATNVADIDTFLLTNNSEIYHTSHYAFDVEFGAILPWAIHFTAFRYWAPGRLVPSPGQKPYLRMTQRNDGIGIARHPRLPVMNVPTSVQLTHAPRIGNKNTYS